MTGGPSFDTGHLVHVSGQRGLYRVVAVASTSGPPYVLVRRAGSLAATPERVAASVLTPAPDGPRYPATIPAPSMYAWESQARQYRFLWTPGLTEEVNRAMGHPIYCLLWYGSPPGTRHTGHARLNGILNYYPDDMPPYQRAGTANVWVHHLQRGHGIGTYLVREAIDRYGLDLDAQNYTESGAALAAAILRDDAP